MRLGLAAGVICTMLWWSAPAADAQSPVSAADVAAFEGTWVLDLVRSGLTSADAERRVITTDPASMRIEVHRPRDVRPFTLIYKFDGSPTNAPFGEGTAVSQLRRDGQSLVAETVYTVKDQPVTVREFLPAAPNGAVLTIEVLVRVEHGYQGVQTPLESNPPNASKTTKFFQRQP
jgi:hypothetical protein